MKKNFAAALKAVLAHEGGFVNHPSDPGGMTNLGCTAAVWEKWSGKPATESVMRALTPADVAPIYRKIYWDRINGDELPDGVDYATFDAAINSGPDRAIRWLQTAAGVTADGIIGPKTMQAVNAADRFKLILRINEQRLMFLKLLRHWDTFGKGWGRRVREVNVTSLRMAIRPV